MARIAAYQYGRVEVALLTGWSLEYIDSLGVWDYEAILQIYEAKQLLAAGKSNGR